MKADYPLLGVLARNPMSGYDLGKWLEADGYYLGRSARMSPIYRALADLTNRGWVEPETVIRATAPDAKVYHLTLAGRAALVEWARSPYIPAPRPMAPDFIVRLNFAGQVGPDMALGIVRTELEYRVAQRAGEAGPRITSWPEAIPEIDRTWLEQVDFITHSRGWQSTSLYIGWLETVKAQLESLLAHASRNTVEEELVIPTAEKEGGVA